MGLYTPPPPVDLASPGPIGGTTPAAITGTTITGTVQLVSPAGTSAVPGIVVGTGTTGILQPEANSLRLQAVDGGLIVTIGGATVGANIVYLGPVGILQTGYIDSTQGSLRIYYAGCGAGVVGSSEWYLNSGTTKILSILSTGLRLDAGAVSIPSTITTPGTTGAQTIDKISGRVNLAAAGTSLVVTCNQCAANDHVLCNVASNDTTCKTADAVPAAGSFTIRPGAAPTAEVAIDFIILKHS